MAKTLNKVELRGRIGHEPRISSLESGSKVARFSVATNELLHVKNDEWKEETSWHNVVAWTSKYVHNLEQLKKGMFVEIVGKLRYTRYTSKSGEERFITEIVASKLTIPSDTQDESL